MRRFAETLILQRYIRLFDHKNRFQQTLLFLFYLGA